MLKKLLISSGGLGAISIGTFYILRINFHKNNIEKDVVYKANPIQNRNEMMKKLQNTQYDILVIGGGATGAGIALDAATRGLKCALVEKGDFSSGTSSKSTKLLHGGIRYLENAVKKLDLTELYFVWEALGERAHTMKIAPFMSRPVSIVMPIYKLWQVPYFACNIKIYDLLAELVCSFEKGIPNSYYIFKTNTLEHSPLLKKEKLKGALIYYDGQHNDTRMNLFIILTSAIDNYVPGQVGATVCNYTEVVDFIKDEDTKNVIGVKAIDKINNKEIDIFAKVIINATGPYGDTVRKLADENREPMIKVSVGCHFILPKWYTSRNTGIFIPKTSDDRVLFILPWENNTLVGTTDEMKPLEEYPKMQNKELNFMIKELANYINVNPDSIRKDIKAAWCGYRPLVVDPKKVKKDGTDFSKQPQGTTTNINKTTEKMNGITEKMNGTTGKINGITEKMNGITEKMNGITGKINGITEKINGITGKINKKTQKSDKNSESHEISRSHEIIEDENGLISILGGKWTIYRKMAQDTIDYVLDKHKDTIKNKYGCRTKFLMLLGSHDKNGIHQTDDFTYGCSKLGKKLVRKYSQIDYETAEYLVSNYGYLAENVCELANELNLFQKLDQSKPYIQAEVIYASRYEFANTISDVLGRRLRLAFLDTQVSTKVIPQVATLLQKELSWTDEQMKKNIQEANKYIQSLSL
ncbi:FAD-dependent glycerol-3-phosphate dehydrogenase, putative [Hepatocystis sp. ex Piliocolobus tephrosceles]|nr:FAD-dependent glycerol-3-phosphate dehydrogenase, putative [Hepatocystis sp. ex Piliocolobus tephrosceles]